HLSFGNWLRLSPNIRSALPAGFLVGHGIRPGRSLRASGIYSRKPSCKLMCQSSDNRGRKLRMSIYADLSESPVNRVIYRYPIHDELELEDVETELVHAIFAVENLYGIGRTRMEAAYFLDKEQRT